MSEKILVSLGGNLPSQIGQPTATIKEAIKLLPDHGVVVQQVSAVYQTAPMPASDQPDFINVALQAETDLTPEMLLDVFQALELKLGRKPAERWSARTLDIDLLAYGSRILPSIALWQEVVASKDPAAILPEPVVPHPRLHKRAFVLIPLIDVAADWRHPVLDENVSDLACKDVIKEQSAHISEISKDL